MTKSNSNSPTVHLGFAIPLTKKPLNQVEYKNNNSNPKKALPRHQQQKYHNVGHQSFHWRNWDGGKIGGQPSWLNPRDLPLKTLRCRSGYCCGDTTNTTTNTTSASGSGTILQFIAQVYCPADDDTKNEAAFHRSLYVFACPTCCSAIAREDAKREKIEEKKEDGDGENAGVLSSRQQQLQQQHHRLSSCIRVLRCQLPLTNDFYPPSTTWPYDDDDFDHQWLLHTSAYWAKQTNNTSLYLCAVCGQRSKGKCPKQQLWFCGVEHQRECLRASKERMMVKSTTVMKEIDDEENDEFDGDDTNYLNDYLPSVCYEYELVVEDEPTPSPATTPCTNPTGDDDNNVSALFPHITDEDNDANLEQSDLNELLARGGAARGGGIEAASSSMMGVTDPITLAFYDRLAIGGAVNDVKNQCLRYCRWPEREKNPVLSNKEEETKKMILQNMMEGGDDSEREDEEEVDIGPLWLSSINCPPPNTETTTTTATTITTTTTQEENSTSCPPSDAATTTIAAADSSITNNSFPPPCQYCGARRSFEFQIMPQMLFYLLHSSKEQKNDGKFGTQKLLSELDKAILFEGQSKIDNGLDLPQGFTEAHGDAMKSAREALLGVMGKEEQAEDNNNTGSKKGEVGGSCLDWGTIAVYTCTASCGNGGIESKENGAYMEEVAWMQPPL